MRGTLIPRDRIFRASNAHDPKPDFTRDFGERFVPGYKRISTVDYLLNSPFKE